MNTYPTSPVGIGEGSTVCAVVVAGAMAAGATVTVHGAPVEIERYEYRWVAGITARVVLGDCQASCTEAAPT